MTKYKIGDRIEMIHPYRAKGVVVGIRPRTNCVVVDFDDGVKGITKVPENIRPIPGSPCPECERPFEVMDDYLCKECRESHT
jgi:hypothetical protein